MAARRRAALGLPRVLKMEAIGVALELVWAHPDATIVKILVREYSVSDATARKIIRDARALVVQEFEKLNAGILVQGALELQAIFRAAFRDKRYAAAVSAKRAQLELMTGGRFEKPEAFGAGKGEDELLYFAEHGFWPEDGSQQPITVAGEEVGRDSKEGDPLALLPPVSENGN